MSGECELFGLEVFFHMLLARGSGQREHPDLHGKPKNDLCGTRTYSVSLSSQENKRARATQPLDIASVATRVPLSRKDSRSLLFCRMCAAAS